MMKPMLLLGVVVCLSALACGEIPENFSIPGPSAPSRVATLEPLTWDSREELRDWVDNAVTRGAVTIEGEGLAAFIRISLGPSNGVLRGPDLAPPATGIRGTHVRARLRHDRPRSPQSVQTEDIHMYFEVPDFFVPGAQPSMRIAVSPSEDWQDLTLRPWIYCCPSPLTVRYAYVSFGGTSPATLDIDRIQFTR